MSPPNKGKGKGIAWIMANKDHAGDECLIWPFSLTNGYGTFGYLGELHYAHRYMCEVVNGPAPSDNHEAAHSCGNGHLGCAHPRHVSWKTKSENQADRALHGRKATGGKGKLTPEQASEIRALKGRVKQRELALIYGVSRANISLIHAGKAWTHPTKHWPAKIAAGHD